MIKVLWISPFLPYDTVAHAGGQIENYYIKGLGVDDRFQVDLLTFANENEMSKNDLDPYHINYQVTMHHNKGIKHLFWGSLAKANQMNVLDPMGDMVTPYVKHHFRKMIREKAESGYMPDVIIVQWTQAVLFASYAKSYFAGKPVVCIEEDVAFLSYQRKYLAARNPIWKEIRKCLYKNLMKIELDELKSAELVINNNYKDLELLKENGISNNTWVWSPYFASLLDLSYYGDSKDIVFYGAMNRQENWKSAIWFIENVMGLLEDPEIRFVIVGNKPPQQLKHYESERIVITGFVDDVSPYLQHAMCLVAPLVLGAGVKIKIIEALSAGVPVLTNGIGIEGINAKDGEEYLHCEIPEDYVKAVKTLSDKEFVKNISGKAKALVEERFNYEKSLGEFKEKIESLCKDDHD